MLIMEITATTTTETTTTTEIMEILNLYRYLHQSQLPYFCSVQDWLFWLWSKRYAALKRCKLCWCIGHTAYAPPLWRNCETIYSLCSNCVSSINVFVYLYSAHCDG